ncbi:hypothetical protein EJB05_15393, partial [Eragrostis curvula]
MAPPPRQPPELPIEIVGDIILRVPPDEPADLLRASLVCKRWGRLLSDPVFRRRYCRYHRTPPLLGFVHNMLHSNPRFVSTVASPCSPPALDSRDWWALDCRHGRVLIRSFAPSVFSVWDPLTRELQRVPRAPYPHDYYTGAVLCDAAGCDHLDCHGGPFRVVVVGIHDEDGSTWVSEYSSETSEWRACASTSMELGSHMSPSLHIGNALYFMVDSTSKILRYDLAGITVSVIDVPEEYGRVGTVVMLEDGRLGFAGLVDHSLYLWSWQEAGTDSAAGWEEYCRVIELATVLPVPGMLVSLRIAGFIEGTGTIFLSTNADLFTVKIKSGRVKKVAKKERSQKYRQYVSFVS